VRGDLTGPGGFRIDGTVEGSIDAQGPVVIGEAGVVDGSVRGRDVVVLGKVRGDVVAKAHLEIGPNGKVVGDVTVESFRMHKGGVFRGTSRMPGAEDLTTNTHPLGLMPAHPRGGRTLPPPAGAVPPPAPEPVSQERLIGAVEPEAGTGTES
jgi:cytoskeletal protein CcmA (bactofilin family)